MNVVTIQINPKKEVYHGIHSDWVKEHAGLKFAAVKNNMNYYYTVHGYSVHVYDCDEVHFKYSPHPEIEIIALQSVEDIKNTVGYAEAANHDEYLNHTIQGILKFQERLTPLVSSFKVDINQSALKVSEFERDLETIKKLARKWLD